MFTTAFQNAAEREVNMRRTADLLGIAAAALLAAAGCGTAEGDGHDAAQEDATPLLLDTGAAEPVRRDCPADLRQDPYDIKGATMSADTLRLDVSYGGGCKTHDFTLCWKGGFIETYPVQTTLQLYHDAHGDPCRAIVSEVLTFDLTALKRAYQKDYPDSTGVIDLRVGNGPRLRYRF